MQDYDDTAACFGLRKGHWEASAAPTLCIILDRGIAQLGKNRIEADTGVSLYTLPPSRSLDDDWLPLFEAATSTGGVESVGPAPSLTD